MNLPCTYAKEIQQLAERFLYDDKEIGYTDIDEWKKVQTKLTLGIEQLIHYEGRTPEEEGEAVLAILMGYTITMRNIQHITEALERANRIFTKISDPVLKCQLAVFCYGECFDNQLAALAHHLIDHQKLLGNEQSMRYIEKQLISIEENGNEKWLY